MAQAMQRKFATQDALRNPKLISLVGRHEISAIAAAEVSLLFFHDRNISR